MSNGKEKVIVKIEKKSGVVRASDMEESPTGEREKDAGKRNQQSKFEYHRKSHSQSEGSYGGIS